MDSALLILDAEGSLDEREASTRLGGRPLLPPAVGWPQCGHCQRALQFLAQVRFGERLLLLFACADAGCVLGGAPNQPTLRALQCAAADTELREPATAQLPLTAVCLVPFDQPTQPYDEARVDAGAFVYGMVGGAADSVSGHVPRCEPCQQPMKFIASLEEGSLFNFAGVQLFGFACATCDAAQAYVDDFF